jgi:hypothetical protein
MFKQYTLLFEVHNYWFLIEFYARSRYGFKNASWKVRAGGSTAMSNRFLPLNGSDQVIAIVEHSLSGQSVYAVNASLNATVLGNWRDSVYVTGDVVTPTPTPLPDKPGE